MKGEYIPVNDGWGIIGWNYKCPECNHITEFTDCEDGCEECGFSEEYVDPHDLFENKNKEVMKKKSINQILTDEFVGKIVNLYYENHNKFLDKSELRDHNIKPVQIEIITIETAKGYGEEGRFDIEARRLDNEHIIYFSTHSDANIEFVDK